MALKIRCLVLDHDDTVVESGKTVNYPALMIGIKERHPEVSLTYSQFCELCYQYNYTGMCRQSLGMTEEEIEDQFAFWKVYVRTHIPPAYEGIGEILTKFRKEGGLICVSSHSGEENICRDYEKNFGFLPDGVYAWELGEALRKPHPYTLLDIMKRFNLPPEEILMIDDMRSGRDMARACGVPFACAGWSHQSEKIRKDMRESTELYFETVRDLQNYLFGDLTDMI